MAGFNENTRVKFPALMHLTRIGYTYHALKELDLDPETNIAKDIFYKQIKKFNPQLTEESISLLLGDIRNKLNNEDLGREFYRMISSNSGIKFIDFEHPEANDWTCVTEMPCINGGDEFRPDITLLINGLPLVFIEVKKPNNKGGILVELHRMNDQRLPNPKFRRFINLTQLMIFSDNKEYDFTTSKPVQGAFYGCIDKKRMHFNVFREESTDFYKKFNYLPLKEDTENYILKDNNNIVLKSSPEYETDKNPTTPTNRIITSLCSRERLLYLLRYGFVYLDYIDEDTQRHVLQKHVMRYPQLFGTQAIRKTIDDGKQSGIIWHTQGSGKTALSYFATRVLTDYYTEKHIIPKFYFFVDRLDLMEQATTEFSNRGLHVINVENRDELMNTFSNEKAQENNSGEHEIIVVNIQKLKDSDGKINVSKYATNIQRVYFLDEAHRDYNPKGSFLSRLFESDPKAIRIALTGTPLIGEERKTTDVFGNYISTYYYNRSIEDGFTKRMMREDIETSYRLRLQEIWSDLEETIKVKKEDIKRQAIIENERYVGALLDYIVNDFKRFRLQMDDPSLGGMIVCETNKQARMMFRLYKMGTHKDEDGHSTYVPKIGTVVPEDDGTMPNEDTSGLKVELILHDYYDKEKRANISLQFRKKAEPDLLIVNNMLLTGFDAPRLKRLYLGRKLKDHNLLQALTRVNRPYKDIRFGYVIDFADIRQNFNDINNAYAAELGKFDTGQSEDASVEHVMVSEDEIKETMWDVQEVLFDYTTDNAEEFAQQMEDIDDHNKLIIIRHKLEEAKATWNEVRTFGSEELKAKVKAMQPGNINNLLKVVNDRISNLNLKDVFNHEAEVASMVNEALGTIEFKFHKKGSGELVINDNLKSELQNKKRALSDELADNIDQDDDDYVSLLDEIKKYFRKKGFEPSNVAEAKEDIGFMDDMMTKIKEINKRNAALQKKYKGDAKFVRAHKRIIREQKSTGKVIISPSEVETCIALNTMKDKIDTLLLNNLDLINNVPFFTDQVKNCITQVLHKMEVKAKPVDRRYLAGIITNEYEHQYKRF